MSWLCFFYLMSSLLTFFVRHKYCLIDESRLRKFFSISFAITHFTIIEIEKFVFYTLSSSIFSIEFFFAILKCVWYRAHQRPLPHCMLKLTFSSTTAPFLFLATDGCRQGGAGLNIMILESDLLPFRTACAHDHYDD